MADYTGTPGDDTVVGGSGDESFDYSQGGHDTLDGGGQDDSFYMGAALDPLDVINGGAEFQVDLVEIGGDYSAGLTITSSMFVSVEQLGLDAGTYRLTIADGIAGLSHISMAPGAGGMVDCSAVSAGLQLEIYGGAPLRVVGGGGDDWFQLNSGDRRVVMVGGAGADKLDLQTASPFHAAGHSFTGIEALRLISGWQVVLADGNVAAGDTLGVTVFNAADLDGHKEMDGHYDFTGYINADRVVGGHLSDSLDGAGGGDTLTGGGGADQLTGGTGADLFVFRFAGQSSVAAPDLITDLEAGDSIDLSAIDADRTQAGVQHFTLVTAFDGHAGEVMLTYDAEAGVTRLLADLKGSGVAGMEIDITGDHADFTNLVL